MPKIEKTGVISASEFIEPDGVDNQFTGNTTSSYTPSTGTNSCMNMGKWMVPDGAVAGDQFQIKMLVEYKNFDRSNTSGTFSMRWQGANYTSPTSSAWQGSNPVCGALNGVLSPTTVVLTATSGSYLYEAYFTLTSDFVSTYYGSNIGVRSDYSNGTGVLTVKNITIIPAQYSTSSTPPQYWGKICRQPYHCDRVYRNLNHSRKGVA